MSDPFSTYSSTLANADLNESTLKRMLAKKLAELGILRGQSTQTGQQNMSGQGLLHSSIALEDLANRNQSVDQQIGDANTGFSDDYRKIQQNRTDAEAAYQAAMQAKTADTVANTPTFNPADPYNWQGIAPTLQPTAPPTGPTEQDPLGWAAINAQIKSGQIADPRLKAASKATPVQRIPKPVVSKITAKPINNIPKQGYY